MAQWTMSNLIFRDDLQSWTADITVSGIPGVEDYTQNIMNIPADEEAFMVKAYVDSFVRDQEAQLTAPPVEAPQDVQDLLDNPQNVG